MEIISTSFELCMSYDWQAMALKLAPKHFAFSFGHLFGSSSNNCGCGTYSQTASGLLIARIIGCDEFAKNYLCR